MQPSSAASTSQSQQPHISRGKEPASKNESQESLQQTESVMSLRSYVLLCREGIPAALEDLYEAADVGTIHEAAWVVIHFLMLETGYICVASEVITVNK